MWRTLISSWKRFKSFWTIQPIKSTRSRRSLQNFGTLNPIRHSKEPCREPTFRTCRRNYLAFEKTICGMPFSNTTRPSMPLSLSRMRIPSGSFSDRFCTIRNCASFFCSSTNKNGALADCRESLSRRHLPKKLPRAWSFSSIERRLTLSFKTTIRTLISSCRRFVASIRNLFLVLAINQPRIHFPWWILMSIARSWEPVELPRRARTKISR